MNTNERWLIVGLGNPGPNYAQTFHNVGFMAIEYLSQKWQIPLNREKFKAIYGQGTHEGVPILLMQPQTFMNLSGEAIQEAAAFFKIPPARILVIYDDLDIELGTLRIRAKGSAGTHNGMRSIVQCLGSTEFPRIRIGIGPKPSAWDIIDYVLAKVPSEYQDVIFKALVSTAEAIHGILTKDLEHAMNTVHRKQSKKARQTPPRIEADRGATQTEKEDADAPML